jgi:SSS family solute:Na+ symporter
VIISLIQASQGVKTNGLEIDSSMFRTNRSFAIGSVLVLAIVTTLYTIYW